MDIDIVIDNIYNIFRYDRTYMTYMYVSQLKATVICDGLREKNRK